MVRPKPQGRCPGVQRCSKILYEMLSRKIVAAVHNSCSSSIYSRQTTLSEMTTAQTVVLAMMQSLLAEDFEVCGLLLRLYSSVEQLRSSYLVVWLRDDFDFPEEDVVRVLSALASAVSRRLLDVPYHLQRVFLGLVTKYPAVQKCSVIEDFMALQFLAERDSESPGLISEENEKLEAHNVRIHDDSRNEPIYEIVETAQRFCGGIKSGLGETKKGTTTGSFGISKSSSDTNIHTQSAPRRRKDTRSMIIDEKGLEISKDKTAVRKYLNTSLDVTENELKKILSSEDSDRRTPLERAASEGRFDLVQQMLMLGADPSARKDRAPAVHLAAEGGHVQVLQLLLEGGADLGVSDSLKKTAIHLAARQGHDFCVSWLHFHGADIESKDGFLRTPLHEAAAGGHLDTVRILLGNKAQLSAKDTEGAEPLHLAAGSGNFDTVQVLLFCGSDLNARDVKGRTPMVYAEQGSHVEVVKLLQSRGGSVD